MTKSECQPSIVERLRSNYASPHHGGCQNCYGIVMDDAADEIERLTERCSAYKGQVEAGAAEIASLKARVAELEAAPPPSTQKVGDHHEALLTFFRWAMNNGPFDGCSLDGGDVQDKAEHLGLIVPTKYDPKVHGEHHEFDEGADFYVFAPALSTNPGEQE
jgi:hypothetical protein